MQNVYVGRAKILEGAEKITIQIPARKNWGVIIFLPIWLCGWLIGLVTVTYGLITGSSFATGPGSPFAIVWLIGWFIGGSLLIYVWLRTISGVEISEFSSESISIGEKILFYERGRSFDARSTLRLRVLAVPEPMWFDQRDLWSGGATSLGFDYGARTIRFGRGVDEAEAAQLLERILSKFPQYQTVALTPSPWNQAFRNRV